MPEIRIQKLIAAAGIASRREAESLITQGRVSVNGEIAVLGAKSGPGDEIRIDNRPIRQETYATRVILLNKPEGYLTTRDDPGKRKTVFGLLPPIERGRWINVGRLDINTTGLLLFTNNGELANRLMHPSSELEREYLCRVYGDINNYKINKLKTGIKLENDKPKAFFASIEITRAGSKNHWVKVVLKEGRYREVRRLWEAVDCRVNRLTRTRYADIELPESLAPGKFSELSRQQVESLENRINSAQRVS